MRSSPDFTEVCLTWGGLPPAVDLAGRGVACFSSLLRLERLKGLASAGLVFALAGRLSLVAGRERPSSLSAVRLGLRASSAGPLGLARRTDRASPEGLAERS